MWNNTQPAGRTYKGHCVCLPARCAWKSRIASRRNRIGRTCVGSARWENGDEWKTGWQGHRQYPPVSAPIAIIAVACSLRPPCLGTSECAQVQKQADPRRRRRVGRVLAPGVLDTRVCACVYVCTCVCVLVRGLQRRRYSFRRARSVCAVLWTDSAARAISVVWCARRSRVCACV